MLITIGLVLTTLLVLLFVYATRRVLIWIGAAVFFAVALHPAVNWAQRRITHRRWLATLLVFLVAFFLLATLTALIIVPLIDEAGNLSRQFPRSVAEARNGRGPIGGLLERLHLRRYAFSHENQLRHFGDRLREPSLGLLRGAVTTVAGTLTVSVLSYLMVLQAPRIAHGTLGLINERHTGRICRVGRECARTVTGYLSGNLLISVICGGLTFAALALLGVPYAGVLALLVALADLVPLVGATVGAVVATGASFFHSTRTGIIMIVFFVVYQQVENHVLQPLIFSRLVRLNPLTVLVSLLIGADLAGIVGALLAIPAAGIIQILAREVRRERIGGTGPADRDPPPTPAWD